MVALRLLAVDDIAFYSWECSRPAAVAYGDVWVVFTEDALLPEFLRHFCRSSIQDLDFIPHSEDFF
ncbi:MAG: hypothetical protein GX885_03935 [Methanomicrobiales archaeon]|nr:hypothetical protein [Methanomicrobiales archaeon]